MLLVSVCHALLAVGAFCSLTFTPGCCFSNRALTFLVASIAPGFVHSSTTSVPLEDPEPVSLLDPPTVHAATGISRDRLIPAHAAWRTRRGWMFRASSADIMNPHFRCLGSVGQASS